MIPTLIERFDKHEERIAEHISGLKTQLDQVHETLIKHTVTEEKDRELLTDIKTAVFGNGVPGLKIRVDRVEQWQGRLRWVLTGIIVPIALYAGYQLIQRLFPS